MMVSKAPRPGADRAGRDTTKTRVATTLKSLLTTCPYQSTSFIGKKSVGLQLTCRRPEAHFVVFWTTKPPRAWRLPHNFVGSLCRHSLLESRVCDYGGAILLLLRGALYACAATFSTRRQRHRFPRLSCSCPSRGP